jgi:hypothetical protein
MDEQRLEQKLNLVLALQEENWQLNKELFSRRFRGYQLVKDDELPYHENVDAKAAAISWRSDRSFPLIDVS